MSQKGILVVFSGPSGAGKGTILDRYFDKYPGAVYSISATTRPPRPGEVDGVHYHFVTKEAFEALIESDQVVEYTIYNGHYYGSPAAPIREQLEKGRDVILEIEVKGAMQVRARFPEALSVFILPPSFAELQRRLTTRGTETGEQIAQRMLTARQEVAMAADYDYVILNDKVEAAADRLDVIIRAAKCSKKYSHEYIRQVLEDA